MVALAFSSNMRDKNGECPICLEKFNSLKLLQCGHAFCTKCIENKLLRRVTCGQDLYMVKCPIDGATSILPDGKVESLKSKLYVDVPCRNCFENKSINDSWWCERCQLTLCSYCVVKKHGEHVHLCKEWKDFDVVQECYALYKSKIGDNREVQEWRNSVHELCVRLEELLVTSVDDNDSLKNALVSMENAFGCIEEISLPEGHTVVKLEQKLSTISNMMQKVSVTSTLPQVSNVVKTKQCPTLPSAKEVFEFCSRSKKSGDSSAEATPSSEALETE